MKDVEGRIKELEQTTKKLAKAMHHQQEAFEEWGQYFNAFRKEIVKYNTHKEDENFFETRFVEGLDEMHALEKEGFVFSDVLKEGDEFYRHNIIVMKRFARPKK